MHAPPHPIDELRAARRDLLAALQGRTAADLLRPGVEGDWCGRDVLLHIATWLRELACLVPDLAIYGYQRGEPCDPRPSWAAWATVRPEAAVAGVVTAHARLLDAVERLDDAGLRRRGPTRFGFATSGWDLLVAEAAHERAHAARLAAHTRRPALALDAPCRPPGPVLRAG
jgi:DinB superfamily